MEFKVYVSLVCSLRLQENSDGPIEARVWKVLVQSSNYAGKKCRGLLTVLQSL